MKTIRLRRAGLEPWIYNTDIKVRFSSPVLCFNMFFQIVHLVRDPRAMITSITKRSGVWNDALKNSTYQCKRMLDDMKIKEGLPEDR